MDPVTLAVVRGALEQIGDEMDLHLIHAAISPIISETNDCANGIFHPVTGETIAQGRYGLPVFLAYMQFAVQNLIKVAEAEGGFCDGDIWITNDPYFGGSHLQDVQLVAPYFIDGKLFALMANTGHWMDVGGNVPGGWAPKAQEIHQEGLIIPPVKLYEGGKVNAALVKMFRANVRLPEQIAGDLAAMANVFAIGRRGLDGLIKRYGADTVIACQDEMIARSERQMRSHIAEIPDGVYTCSDHFDNDGIVDEPIPIALTVTVRGDAMHLDFTGTAGVSRGPFNISRNTTLSSCYVALKHIFPDVPINGGTFRPVDFTVPEGSMLAAQYPAAVGAYLEPVGRILDLIFGALAQAIPDRVPAPFFGTTGPTSVSGLHPRTKGYFVGVFPYPGGYGASKEFGRARQWQSAAVHGEFHVPRTVGASLSAALRLFRAARGLRRGRLAPRGLRHDLRLHSLVRHHRVLPRRSGRYGAIRRRGGRQGEAERRRVPHRRQTLAPGISGQAGKAASASGRRVGPPIARRRRFRRPA